MGCQDRIINLIFRQSLSRYCSLIFISKLQQQSNSRKCKYSCQLPCHIKIAKFSILRNVNFKRRFYQSVWHRLEDIIQTKRKLHFREPNWIIKTMKIDQYLQSFNTYIYFNLQQFLTRVHSPRNSQVFLNWKGTGNSENSSNMARRDMKPRDVETKNETKDHLLIFCSDPIAGSGLQLSSLQRSLLYIISSAIYASGTNTNSRTFYQNHRLITQISMTHQGVSHYNYKLIQNIQCSSQRTPLGSRVRHPLNHPALLTPGVSIQTTI
ncbi:unnamed protein product [Paramecium octaurelia]|uniref:Uncharacterized protein n=1 Tax=Paramecium octaurelia TaxID=43137 RepID=A0A8S1WTU9_PAROT|nr:unnamed protein product [Paramecium octaurelia]